PGRVRRGGASVPPRRPRGGHLAPRRGGPGLPARAHHLRRLRGGGGRGRRGPDPRLQRRQRRVVHRGGAAVQAAPRDRRAVLPGRPRVLRGAPPPAGPRGGGDAGVRDVPGQLRARPSAGGGMFAWFRPRCPLGTWEKTWTEQRMGWLARQFGLERLRRARVVLPTPEFFGGPYEARPEDARRFMARLCPFMGLDFHSLQLEVLADEELQGATGQYSKRR